MFEGVLADDLRWLEKSRKDGIARVSDACRVQAGNLPLAAQLYHLQLAHDGVAVDGLREPEETVSDREHCAVVLDFGVLPEQDGGGLIARERERKALHDIRQLQLASRPRGERAAHHGAEGV